jgi:2-C-methyl-D-erythritol 4-phosphate cytidylyltransferase
MPNHVIVAAAGEGRRFGGAKQFFLFRDHPLFIHVLHSFELNKGISSITLVVPKNKITYAQLLIKKHRLGKVRNIVAGGKRRQDSVLKGLDTIKYSAGIVAIHDGVRPIVSQRLINQGIKLCRRYKAVIFGSIVRDTVKLVKNNKVNKTVDRKNLYLIQTPQFFGIRVLKNAYKMADLSKEYTDEAALLESLSLPVYCFTTDNINIKITRKSDLKLLSKIL